MSVQDKKNLISYEELSKHCQKTDCWIALQGHVIDLTSYLAQYTSDQEFFVQNAGRDATYPFSTLEKEGKEALLQSLIDKFSVGTLDYDSPKIAPKQETKSVQRMYTYSEIHKHNKGEDCWVIYKDMVFDVTKFLDEHPGGAATILEYGGADLTEPYIDHNHSHHATKLLMEYQVGVVDLNSKEEFLKAQASNSRKGMAFIGVAAACILAAFLTYILILR